MKFFSFCVLLIAACQALGQQPTMRSITYKISVGNNSSERVEGYLFNLTDTSLKVGFWPVSFRNLRGSRENVEEINYRQISEIRLKRHHGAARGAWKGAVIGLLTGALAGFIEGDDPPEYWFGATAAEKALAYGALGAGAGTGIGAIIGALAKKRFIIGGNRNSFDEMKANVLTKVYGKGTVK